MNSCIKFAGLLGLAAMIGTGCQTKNKTCHAVTEVKGQAPLTDISLLKENEDIADTLKAHPELQVYRLEAHDGAITMHCHVFYQGIQVFASDYLLNKRTSDGYTIINYSDPVNQVSFSLTPAVSAGSAVETAKKKQDFTHSCVNYELGIYDLNAGTIFQPLDLRLVWKVSGNGGNPGAIINAQTGEVISDWDGVIYETW